MHKINLILTQEQLDYLLYDFPLDAEDSQEEFIQKHIITAMRQWHGEFTSGFGENPWYENAREEA